MPDPVEEQIQSVLQAMSGLLGFTSTVLARQDSTKGGLVLTVAPRGPGPGTQFRHAVDVLGFDPSGAVFPLWAEDAVFVRCYRQGRLLSTTSLAELIGSALPGGAVGPIDELVGPRLYVAVPVISSSWTILGVIMLDRADTTPLGPDERDRLLLYADRVGQLLEAARLGEPAVTLHDSSPLTRWLSVHLLHRSLAPVWSGGAGPDAGSVIDALGGRLQPGTREVTLPDGAAVLVHVNVVDPKGHVAWLVLCEDLAGRDRETRDLREQLRLHLARVQEAVVSVDAGLRITGCNDAARAVFGSDPAEMIGEPVSAFLPGGDLSDVHKGLVEDLIARGHVDGQVTLRRRDGTPFPANVSVLLQSDEHERPSGAIATVRDLSEQRRQAAERLRLRRRLLRSERLAALGEMAARIAHEVRNPLAAIGATAMAIEEDGEAEAGARGRAKAISAEVRRLDVILTDLLQFARPRPAVRQRLDIGDLVRRTVAVTQADPLAKEIDFAVCASSEAELVAPVDPDAMRQVMLNVLRNAVEACAPRGHITCTVSRGNGTLRIEVSDDGPGLPPEARRRVFEPFFSTKSRGTGLGLPISRRIVDEHKGRMRLRARRSGGTTVSIELPAMPRGRGASEDA
jgi:PAS domain S-box-containing protein